MKKKFSLFTLLLITLAQLNSFAQHAAMKLPAFLPLVAEDGIYSITVSENVNLVLIQDKPEKVGVKASDDVLSKLEFSINGGELTLATSKILAANERLTVFVWVNDLENLTLKGNAMAVSQGILESRNLHISATTEATVSIKSKGKVWFDAPGNYQLTRQKGYLAVNVLKSFQN